MSTAMPRIHLTTGISVSNDPALTRQLLIPLPLKLRDHPEVSVVWDIVMWGLLARTVMAEQYRFQP